MRFCLTSPQKPMALGLGVTSHINARGDSIAQAAQMPHNRPEQDQMPRLRRISSMSFRSSSTGAAGFALVFGRAVVFAGSRDGENFGSGDAVTTQDIRDVTEIVVIVVGVPGLATLGRGLGRARGRYGGGRAGR